MERSKHASLELHCDDTVDEELLDIIRPHRHRLRWLEIHPKDDSPLSSYTFAATMLADSVPAMTSFVVRSTPDLAPFQLDAGPPFEEIRLIGASLFPWTSPRLEGLQRLELGELSNPPSPLRIWEIISASPKLMEIALIQFPDGEAGWGTVESLPPLRHDRLSDIYLHDMPFKYQYLLLWHIDTPSSIDTYLDFFQDSQIFADQPDTKLLSILRHLFRPAQSVSVKLVGVRMTVVAHMMAVGSIVPTFTLRTQTWPPELARVITFLSSMGIQSPVDLATEKRSTNESELKGFLKSLATLPSLRKFTADEGLVASGVVAALATPVVTQHSGELQWLCPNLDSLCFHLKWKRQHDPSLATNVSNLVHSRWIRALGAAPPLNSAARLVEFEVSGINGAEEIIQEVRQYLAGAEPKSVGNNP